MFKPTQMTKITVIGTKTHLSKVIDALYSLNALHIEEHVKTDLLDIGEPLDSAESLSETIVELNAAISALCIDEEKEQEMHLTKKISEILPEIKKIVSEVKRLEERSSLLSREKESLEHKLKALKILKKAGIELSKVSGKDSLSGVDIFVGESKDNKISNDLKKISLAVYDMFEYEKKMIFSIVAKKNVSEEVKDLLTKNGVNIINFKGFEEDFSGKLKNKKTEEAISILSDEISDKNQELNRISVQLNKIAGEKEHFLLEAKEILNMEDDKAKIPLRFGSTEKTFIVTGFIPSDDLLKVHRTLSKVTGDKILIYINKVTDESEIPIQMNHPALVRPFEFFMNLFSLPTYKELDPTFFTFLTFPFFFGFMLGDMGYGLINLLLFSWLRKKMPKARGFFTILIWSSILTIICGAAFGEFMGFEEFGHFELPHLLSRTHQQMDLLYLSIGLGVFHILFALVLGFINELRHHGFWHAIFSKVSWMILLAGAGMFMINQPILGYSLIGLSVVMLLAGEGVIGLIELPGIFGNILSYARLMAIGLASVSLAVIINEFVLKFISQGGIGMFIAAAFLMVFGHVINMLLGLIGPFLHSLRLHYVEFFSKFYKGGGRLYEPFGYPKEKMD